MKNISLTDRFMKTIEYLGSKNYLIWSIYYRSFYKKILEREISLCALEPGSRVVHVGCGALPLTALTLARAGMEIEAIERDPVAAERASGFLRRAALQDRISVTVADGLEVDYSEADAVWISLSASPKRAILERVLTMVKSEARVVCRNSRGILSVLYDPINTELSCPSQRTRQPLGKETIFMSRIVKNENMTVASGGLHRIEETEHSSSQSEGFLSFPDDQGELRESCPGESVVPLITLRDGVEAIISSVPSIPLLPPLGFRPGKKVCVRGMGCLGGPVFAEVEERSVALGRSLAREIKVMLLQEEG